MSAAARRSGRPVAIVTGGSSGIGTCVARDLLVRGFAVLVVGRHPERVEGVVAELRRFGVDDVSGFAGDVSVAGVAAEYVAVCRERHGDVTAFVNAAAYEGLIGRLDEHPLADFDRVMAVNVRGAFLGLQAVVPTLRAAGGGRIVNVASQAGVRGVAGCAAYAASKHALIGLSNSLALELAEERISVNVVSPGPTDTEMIKRVERTVEAGGGEASSIAAQIPTRRYGAPEEVAATIAWLVTDAPHQLTGAVVPVDGGLTTG